MESNGRAAPASSSANGLIVVDDDPEILNILEGLLSPEGYVVALADSGAAALDLLATRPDTRLIITDLSMPGMDGVEVIQRARQNHPQLPAIVLTGLADSGVADMLRQIIGGKYKTLGKPFDAASLLESVAGLVGRAEQR